MSSTDVGFVGSPKIQESGPSLRTKIRNVVITPSRTTPKPPPAPTCQPPAKEKKKELSSKGGIVGKSGSNGSSAIPSKGLCVGPPKAIQSGVQLSTKSTKSLVTVSETALIVRVRASCTETWASAAKPRSEEHTSELQ